MIVKAKIKENDNLLIQRWMLHHSTEMSLDEFKESLKANQIDTSLTEEKIMEDVENILKQFRG